MPPPGDWPCGPGDYFQDRDGSWRGESPNGLPVWLKTHAVTEHEDGTITVSPSILVGDRGKKQWHGYLERGIWREC